LKEGSIKLFTDQAEMKAQRYEGYEYIPLLDDTHGCQAGCRTGLLMYTQEEYRQGGIHEDQEGFFVVEGTGEALVGENNIMLRPGVCFIVPPGFYHSIKRDSSCKYVKLFFFHAAI